MLTITITGQQLLEKRAKMVRDGRDNWSNNFNTASESLGKHYKTNLVQEAPEDKDPSNREKGRLKRGLSVRIYGNDETKYIRPGSEAPYTRFVIEGTKAHSITAKDGRYLGFYWYTRGFYFSGKSVNHPGTSPNKFDERAIIATRTQYGPIFTILRSSLGVS